MDMIATGERVELHLTCFRAEVDQRFAAIDQRFAVIDQRFAVIDQHFVDLERRMLESEERIKSNVADQFAGARRHATGVAIGAVGLNLAVMIPMFVMVLQRTT